MIVRNNCLECQGNEPRGFNILWGHNTWWLLYTSDVLTLSSQNVFLSLQSVFCENVLCSANVLPLSACFLISVLCWHVRFYLRIKQHTVISQWKTQHVYSFSAVFITYSCSRPAVARKRKSARIRRTVAESLKWASDYMLWRFVLKGGF
jgi:hypothetical protein